MITNNNLQYIQGLRIELKFTYMCTCTTVFCGNMRYIISDCLPIGVSLQMLIRHANPPMLLFYSSSPVLYFFIGVGMSNAFNFHMPSGVPLHHQMPRRFSSALMNNAGSLPHTHPCCALSEGSITTTIILGNFLISCFGCIEAHQNSQRFISVSHAHLTSPIHGQRPLEAFLSGTWERVDPGGDHSPSRSCWVDSAPRTSCVGTSGAAGQSMHQRSWHRRCSLTHISSTWPMGSPCRRSAYGRWELHGSGARIGMRSGS